MVGAATVAEEVDITAATLGSLLLLLGLGGIGVLEAVDILIVDVTTTKLICPVTIRV